MRRLRVGAQAAVLAVCVGVLLWPALWNGFPIVFHDSGSYIGRYLEQSLDWGRSVGYGLFLGMVDLVGGLWPPIVVQALLTVWAIWLVLRVLDAPHGPRALFAVVTGLAVLTGLPWYTAQIMPDIFAPLMVVALFLLGFCQDRLTRAEIAGQAAVVVLAILVHMSHLALGTGLVLVTAAAWLIRRLWRSWLPGISARPVVPALVLATGVLAAPVVNGLWTGHYVFTPGGTTFIFGRLVHDGIVQRFLDDNCPSDEFQLCQYKDQMPHTANDYLWVSTSPFYAIGAWEGGADEMRTIALRTIHDYPWLHVTTALGSAWQQFFTFKTGDLLDDNHWYTRYILEDRLPDLYAQYLQSRQGNYEIKFHTINLVHEPVAYLSLASLLLAIAWSLRTGRHRVSAFSLFILLALVGNALICGALSNPSDRYQSRLIWLATLAVTATAGRALAEHNDKRGQGHRHGRQPPITIKTRDGRCPDGDRNGALPT